MWIPAEGPEDKKNFGGEDGKGGRSVYTAIINAVATTIWLSKLM